MDSNKEQYYKEQMTKAIQVIRQLKSNTTLNEPIAIIGMACRFPKANNAQKFWEMLKNGVDAISDIPEHRWEVDKFYNEQGEAGKMYVKRGGFIEEVETFDAQYFGIAPQEATYMDPQQRILLELTCEALEEAGIDLDSLKGSNTGVFIGMAGFDYNQRHFTQYDTAKTSQYSITGAGIYSAAGRISYTLGLEGSSFVVSTACSSSLVALHNACMSLQTGESNMAVVGGANLILSPETSVSLCQMGALSKEGKSKTFDASADGYVRGEGMAIIIVKRLSDAVKDKDNVLAVIKSTFVNQDGKSNGFTAPNSAAQEKMLAGALEKAKISSDQVDYIEAHGTGTPLGDPIELDAIQKIYKARKDKPLWVGTVKTNMGHTEGTAGLAGIIKVVLSMRHKQIPPNLHFHTPNPNFNWSGANFKVPTQLTAWENDGKTPRTAGVNSFGVSGTNAHAIIEEATPELISKIQKETQLKWLHNILPLSAKSDKALKAYAQSYIDFLRKNIDIDWKTVCAAAALHRTHFSHRKTIVAKDVQEAITKLEDYVQNGEEANTVLNPEEPQKIVFVFPGQGSQWIGMGKVFYEQSDVFRQVIDDCEKAFSPYLDWSLKEELVREEQDRFGESDFLQPSLIAMEIGLAKLWQSVGIQPDAVVGHSMGEIASAYVSGALSLEDVGKIVCSRSQLMKALDGKGKMLSVELTVEQAKKAIGEAGLDKRISVAVSNSPQATVLSGDIEGIDTIKGKLENEGVECKEVKVNLANHSPQMDALKEPLKGKIKDIKPTQNNIPFYSTVKTASKEGKTLTPTYWVDNLREPVMFADTVQLLLEDGYTTFIEIAPHPLLSVPMQQIIQAGEFQAVPVISLLRNRDAVQEFTNSIGKLYCAGYPIDWAGLYSSAPHISLPTYPWQRKRFWLEPDGLQVGTQARIALENEENEATETLPIAQFFKQKLAKVAGYTLAEITDNLKLAQMGIDSMMLTQIRQAIETTYNINFSTKDFWQFPTIKQFADFLQGLQGGETENKATPETTLQGSLWFDKPLPRPDAVQKLFCFHHAGGSASMYYPWAKMLPDFVELIAVQLPGRAERMAEPHYQNMDVLVQDLLQVIEPELDRPFAFFGHSMGCLVSFALTRELRKHAKPLPTQLFLSASAYFPTFKGEKLHTRSDKELLALFPDFSVENFGGDQEYFNIVFRALRADLDVVGSFKHEKEAPLDLPIIMFGGEQDVVAPPKDMVDWGKETTQKYNMVVRTGGHDYISHEATFLTEYITEQLTSHMVQLQS